MSIWQLVKEIRISQLAIAMETWLLRCSAY